MTKLLTLLLIFSSKVILASESFIRADLQKIAPLACSFAATAEYWKKGVFDSQIAVAVYQLKSTADKVKIEKIISDQLKLEHHRGYFTAECEKDKIFIVTTPSPVQYGDEKLKKILAESCQKFFIDQVSLHGVSSPSELTSLIPKDNTSTALTCRLENTNQEWFLIPPSNWKDLMTFSSSSMGRNKQLTEKSSQDKIFHWINEKRKAEKISLLTITEGLNQAAKNLNESSQILHNRKALKEELLDLRMKTPHKDAKFLLEDRVEALSIDEALNLLWWSPKHRDLILSTKITRIGISANIDAEKIKISLLGAG